MLNTDLTLLWKKRSKGWVNNKVTKSRDQLKFLEGSPIFATSNTYVKDLKEEQGEKVLFSLFQDNKTLWKFWVLSMSLIPFGESQVWEEQEDTCAHIWPQKIKWQDFLLYKDKNMLVNPKEALWDINLHSNKGQLWHFDPTSSPYFMINCIMWILIPSKWHLIGY